MTIFTSVKVAEPEDTHEVMSLLVNTAEWLLKRGSSQWSGLLRGEDSHNTPEAVNRGEVYLFKQDSQIVGMVMLLKSQSPWDQEIWGEENQESALFLHRLAINRKFAGKNMGRSIMKWVEDSAPAMGSTIIRLDCLASNSTLNEFYKGLGYTYVGNATNAYGEYSKYEKKV